MKKILKFNILFLFCFLVISCSGSYEISEDTKTKINLNEGIIIICDVSDNLNIVQKIMNDFGSKGYQVSNYYDNKNRYTFKFSYSWKNDFPFGKVFSEFNGELTDRKKGITIKTINFSQGAFTISKKVDDVLKNVLSSIYSMHQNNDNITEKENPKTEQKSSGSGVLISKNGYIVTIYHVIENAKKIEVIFPEKSITKNSVLEYKDQKNDLVILKLQNFSYQEISDKDIPFSFVKIKDVKVGQDVYTLGFPLGDFMGSKSRLSTGVIQSLYGIQDDPRLYQINNPLQPGNSGGALFNKKGELVGICVSSLNAKYFYENVGIIPQNVNFAIKISYL